MNFTKSFSLTGESKMCIRRDKRAHWVSVVIATLLPCLFMLPSEHASDCAMM
jgi:hypothetical protein